MGFLAKTLAGIPGLKRLTFPTQGYAYTPLSWGPLHAGRDYVSSVGDGSGNSIVSACVNWIARTFPEAPPALWRRDASSGVRSRVLDSDYVQLLRHPNPFMSGHLMWATLLDAFVPADNIARLEDEHKISYRPWIGEGWLALTDGDVIDERAIVRSIERRQAAGFAVQEIACNPRGATALMRSLDEAGFTVTSVLPSFAAMSPAMNELEKLVRSKRIAHSGDRLLAHMIRNLQARRNADGDLKPDAEKSTGTIAGPTALLMALSRVLAVDADEVEWAAL